MVNQEVVFFAERGRRDFGGVACYAYFEVRAPVPGFTTLEVVALDDRRTVLGIGRCYKSEEFRPGFLFEVFFHSVPAHLVHKWQFQLSSYGQRKAEVYLVDMLTPEQWKKEGARVDYIRAPAGLVAVTNKLPNLKNGWRGKVVASVRSEIFHHPGCSKAMRIKETTRVEFESPQVPWEEGLSPCEDCLWTLP